MFSSAQVVMTMKVNPKLRLPQNMLNFFITRLAGVFLYLQHQKATEVIDDPAVLCTVACLVIQPAGVDIGVVVSGGTEPRRKACIGN